MRVRFLAAIPVSECVLVDNQPGDGEVSRAQAMAWRAGGIPMEFIDDDGRVVELDAKLTRKRK